MPNRFKFRYNFVYKPKFHSTLTDSAELTNALAFSPHTHYTVDRLTQQLVTPYITFTYITLHLTRATFYIQLAFFLS